MEAHRWALVWIRLAAVAASLSLAGSVVAAQLSLTWTDNASNEGDFQVERSPISSATYAQIASVGPNVTTYVDTTVTSGQGYCYRVRAFNGVGASGYTNVACATVPAMPPATYTLTVNKTGSGTGTVSGPGISCGTDCSQSVTSGTPVTLTATPATGSTFAGWSGACSGTGGCTVTVSANTLVGATFDSTPSAAVVEIVAGAEPGSAPRVRGLTRAGVPTATDFLAYASSFTGGVFVGLGSLGSPGSPVIVTGSGAGIPAEVRAFHLDGSSAGASFRAAGDRDLLAHLDGHRDLALRGNAAHEPRIELTPSSTAAFVTGSSRRSNT